MSLVGIFLGVVAVGGLTLIWALMRVRSDVDPNDQMGWEDEEF